MFEFLSNPGRNASCWLFLLVATLHWTGSGCEYCPITSDTPFSTGTGFNCPRKVIDNPRSSLCCVDQDGTMLFCCDNYNNSLSMYRKLNESQHCCTGQIVLYVIVGFAVVFVVVFGLVTVLLCHGQNVSSMRGERGALVDAEDKQLMEEMAEMDERHDTEGSMPSIECIPLTEPEIKLERFPETDQTTGDDGRPPRRPADGDTGLPEIRVVCEAGSKCDTVDSAV